MNMLEIVQNARLKKALCICGILVALLLVGVGVGALCQGNSSVTGELHSAQDGDELVDESLRAFTNQVVNIFNVGQVKKWQTSNDNTVVGVVYDEKSAAVEDALTDLLKEKGWIQGETQETGENEGQTLLFTRESDGGIVVVLLYAWETSTTLVFQVKGVDVS